MLIFTNDKKSETNNNNRIRGDTTDPRERTSDMRQMELEICHDRTPRVHTSRSMVHEARWRSSLDLSI